MPKPASATFFSPRHGLDTEPCRFCGRRETCHEWASQQCAADTAQAVAYSRDARWSR
jgi:hypothetical protein